MTNVNMKAVEKKAAELGNDMELVKKELKRVQSVKCRLAKQKGRKDYEAAMKECLAEEQLLKEVRNLLDPKEVTVPSMTQADVDRLDFDQTVKAIKSIQSKKTLTKWLTDVEGDNDEYRNACRVEAMLLQHKQTVKPLDDALVRKSQLQALVEVIETTPDITPERIAELLKSLIANGVGYDLEA